MWWREPGGSPIYLSAIITDSQTRDDVLHAELKTVEDAWGTRPIGLWDCWAVRDLHELGFKRAWVESWYLRPPLPLPGDLKSPSGLSIEAVTDNERLAEFEQASWEGFEMPDAARGVGRFGQHAPGTLEDEGMGYLMARLKGRAVASAIAYATKDMVGIYGVSTVPEHRRRGYATSLVRAAVSLHSDLPVSTQPDPETVRMYTNLGFAPAGQIAAWRKGF